MGLERLLLALPDEPESDQPFCFFAPMGELATNKALSFSQALRQRGIRVEVDSRGGRLKAMLRRADTMKARLVVVLGESEMERSVAAVKDLSAHTQIEIGFEQLVPELVERLSVEAGRIA